MREDGLYDVTNKTFSAGFIIEDGEVVWCAPILRKRLDYWMARATLIKAGRIRRGVQGTAQEP